MLNVVKNRCDEHLSCTDRDGDVDNGNPQYHVIDQEHDHNKVKEFNYINSETENNMDVGTSMSLRQNMYLTSDFDTKRDRNNFVSSGLTAHSRENKRHMLDHAMNVEPWSKRNYSQARRQSSDNFQSPPKRERSSSTSSQSDFFQKLCKKYPQAFHYKFLNSRGQRPSRQLFNSGLRVRFEDDTLSLGDTASVTSERPMSKYDKEIEEMLGSRMDFDRDCMTSPTPSMVSDTSTKENLNSTSESLRQLLQHRKYHRAKLAYDLEHKLKRHSLASNISETGTSHDPLSDLERELEYRERILQTLNERNKRTDENQNERQMKPSHWRVHSPESVPDSAIDVDTSSVQSGGSADRRYEQKLNGSDLQQYSQMNCERGDSYRKQGKILVRKGVVHKDSDVDSGIVPTSVSDDVPIDPPSYNKASVSSRLNAELAGYTTQLGKPGQRSKPSPIKADHSLMLNLYQSDPTDEEDSIAQEIITAQMSADLHVLPQKQRPSSHVHFEDEVDDTDPRLGIPTMTGEEREMAERYRRRRSPMPFVINRNCLSARDEKRKTNGENRQSRSDNRVSVLCTPRERGDSNLQVAEFNGLNGAVNGDVKRANQQILYSQKFSNLKTQEKYSSSFSSQPNLSTEVKSSHRTSRLPEKSNGHFSRINHQRIETKSSLIAVSQPTYNDQIHGALLFKESKSLSKSQPNLAPVSENAVKGRQSVSRTSSSNSDHSSQTLVSSQMNVNGDDGNSELLHRLNHNVPFSARQTRKKLHLKKYFKAKKGKYNPSLEENCFGELGHGTSMPDLSGVLMDKKVQYSQESKHRSMQNIYFQSKDLDTDSDEEVLKPNFKSKHLSKTSAIPKNTRYDSSSDKDSGVEARELKSRGNAKSKDGYSSSGSNQEPVRHKNYKTQQPRRVESDSSSQSCFSNENENLQKLKKKYQLTPYESSVVHLDKKGIDVNELIESDSDSFSAKYVVIDKEASRKNANAIHNTHVKSDHIVPLSEAQCQQHERRYKKKGENPHIITNNISSSQNEHKIHNDHARTDHDQHKLCAKTDHDQQKVCAKTHSQPDVLSRTSISSSVSSMSQEQMSISSDQSKNIPKDLENVGNSDRTFTVEKKPHVVGPTLQDQTAKHQAEIRVIKSSVGDEDFHETPVHVYAEVNLAENKKMDDKAAERRQLHNKLSASTPDIAGGFDNCVDIEINENPIVPDRLYKKESNLLKTKELSASKQSLSDKMGGFKKSAKSKFKAIRKAVSMDKGIDQIEAENQPKVKDKKKKEKKGFFGLFSKKKSKQTIEKTAPAGGDNLSAENNPTSDMQFQWNSCNSIDSVQDEQKHMRSRLCQINTDGTHVIEIHKPCNKAIDFFISRGNAQFKHGIFVSRFIDSKTNKYAGLLSVGDEIIKVNGFKVRDLLLDDVYGLLSNAEKINLTILPLLARKDV